MSGIQKRAMEALNSNVGQVEFVDMAIDLYEWNKRALITSVGGRWDVEYGEWADDEPRSVVRWRVQPAQYKAAYFIAEWIAARQRGERLVGEEDTYVLMGIGGRGGGKSDFGVRAGLLLSVAFREFISWYASPVLDETKELQRVIETELPASWYHHAEDTYFLWNGSYTEMMSGYSPGTLKRGRVDYWLLNEAQRFQFEAYKMIRPRLADQSGLGYIAANPPRESKGRWVMKFHDRIKGGEIPDIKLLEFDPKLNPTIDWRSLELLRPSFGDIDFRREILGEMIPIGDLVFYAWSSIFGANVRPVPDIGNATRRWTKKRLGRAFDHIISIDFNKIPHNSATAIECFNDSDDPDDVLTWYTGEWDVHGSEHDLVDAWEAVVDENGNQVYTPENTALIPDATGWHQNPERTKGRPSQQILAARGYKCYRPDKRLKNNPIVPDRVLVANARFCDANGKRRAFCSPDCPLTAEALKNYENKHGKPYSKSDFSHRADSATYGLYRLFPRVMRKAGSFHYETVKHARSNRDRDLDSL